MPGIYVSGHLVQMLLFRHTVTQIDTKAHTHQTDCSVWTK